MQPPFSGWGRCSRTKSQKNHAVVVVSAMGKTTNALEEVWSSLGPERTALWSALLEEHVAVAEALGAVPERGGHP